MSNVERYADTTRTKVMQITYYLFFFGSWALAIYAFIVGNVWGGFGIAMVTLITLVLMCLVDSVVSSIDEKYLWEAALKQALKQARKEVGKE